jgi:putative ABC transport system substrate-binding protein
VEVGPKLLSLLHEAVPSAASMALLVNPTNPNIEAQSKDLQAGVRRLGLQARVLNASTERDFGPVFANLRELRIDTLMIAQDPLFNAQSQQLAELAMRHTTPAIYELREFVEAGGLMSYGTNQAEAWRQAGIYVGRVLKGEKAADLPVMQPSKFEFIVNLKTAKALGLEIPPTLIARADEVIE